MAKSNVGATIEWKPGKDPASLVRKLRALESTLDDELEAAAEEVSIRIMRDAQRQAPVDTGRLRASLDQAVERLQTHTVAALVGSNVAYAPIQEVTQPYLVPAVEANREFILDRYEEAFSNAMADVR